MASIHPRDATLVPPPWDNDEHCAQCSEFISGVDPNPTSGARENGFCSDECQEVWFDNEHKEKIEEGRESDAVELLLGRAEWRECRW